MCPVGYPVHVIQRGNNRQTLFTSDADIAAYAHGEKANTPIEKRKNKKSKDTREVSIQLFRQKKKAKTPIEKRKSKKSKDTHEVPIQLFRQQVTGYEGICVAWRI